MAIERTIQQQRILSAFYGKFEANLSEQRRIANIAIAMRDKIGFNPRDYIVSGNPQQTLEKLEHAFLEYQEEIQK